MLPGHRNHVGKKEKKTSFCTTESKMSGKCCIFATASDLMALSYYQQSVQSIKQTICIRGKYMVTKQLGQNKVCRTVAKQKRYLMRGSAVVLNIVTGVMQVCDAVRSSPLLLWRCVILLHSRLKRAARLSKKLLRLFFNNLYAALVSRCKQFKLFGTTEQTNGCKSKSLKIVLLEGKRK